MRQIKESLILLCILWMPCAVAVQMSVEPSVLTFGDTVTLRLIATEPGEPKVAPLSNDFEIINQSRSSQFSVINGKSEQKYIWEYTLLPKKAGQLKLPSLSIGSQRTPERLVIVNQANLKNEKYLLLGEVDRTEQYVGGEIIYSLKLLHRVPVGGTINLPQLNAFEQATLKEQSNYRTVYQKIHYDVVEWRYALVAQKSGNYQIKPAKFSGQVKEKGRVKHLRIASQPINLSILPQPKTWLKSDAWLPAKSVKLWEDWDPKAPEWKVGESVTRSIHLEVDGVLPSQISDIHWHLPDGIKAYSDNAKRQAAHKDDALRSRFEQTWVLVSNASQTVTFPEIVVRWWDTESEQVKQTVLPARTVQVKENVAGSSAELPNVVVKGLEVGADQHDTDPSEAMVFIEKNHFNWFFGLLAMTGWLCAAVLWRINRQHNQQIKTSQHKPSSMLRSDELFCQLKHAQAQSDAKRFYHLGLRWLNRKKYDQTNALAIQAAQALHDFQAMQEGEHSPADFASTFAALNACKRHVRQPNANIPPLYPGEG